MLGMREEPVLFKHLRQVDEDGLIAFACFEARTGEESIAMALEPRCLDLGDFLVDHFLRDGGFAELCFVECVALGVLRYHIEFATRFVCGIVVPVLANGVESRFDLAGPVLPHEVLTADLLEHMRNVVFLEVLGDVTIIEDFRVEQLTRRGIAENVAIVKERKWVHYKVARLALVRRVVDGCALLDDFE